MPEPAQQPESAANPFWDFSLALYAAPGVARACLGLQDALGADVNLLLFCCWAGRRGHALEAAELDRLLAAGGAWQEAVLRPLRAARRGLKPLAAGDPAARALREDLKALELAAERLEQDRLQATLPLPGGAASEALVAANLERYLLRLGEAPAGEAHPGDAVAILAAAAVP